MILGFSIRFLFIEESILFHSLDHLMSLVLNMVKAIHSTSMSSFRTKWQGNHAATAIEISTTLLLQIDRIV